MYSQILEDIVDTNHILNSKVSQIEEDIRRFENIYNNPNTSELKKSAALGALHHLRCELSRLGKVDFYA